MRHIGSKVGYSSIGPQVAISAPAGNCVNLNGNCLYPILTTINAGTTTPSSNTYSDGTNYSVGTSFATPIVAGAAALMLSVNPNLSPAEVKAKLQATARPFPTSGATDASVTTCQAPSSIEQLECYCTTSTCGAGLLDVGAAVAAVAPVSVAPPTAAISASNTTPTAGDTVTLNSTGSAANGGRSIASYQWAITSGGTLASISGASTGSTLTLLTSAAGSVTVSLTVTDSAGASGTTTSTVNVQACGGQHAPPTARLRVAAAVVARSRVAGCALLALAVALLRRVRPAVA